MLVIFGNDCLLSPQHVCQSCLLATQEGLPRWHQGKLGCSRSPSVVSPFPVMRCAMGFEVAQIPDPAVKTVD